MDFGFHGLRHTFASLQGDLGTGAVAIKATQVMEDHILSILKESKSMAKQA